MSDPFLGEIRLFAFTFAPRGWFDCSGQILSIAQNTALFSLLGTTYGGNGQTTFALPNLNGRVPVHQGQGPGLSFYSLGQVAGSETVTLLPTQMPAHTHQARAVTAAANEVQPGPGVMPGAVSGQTMYATDLAGSRAFSLGPQATSVAGGSQPHQNCMPTLVARYCIAAQGIFPSRN
jgi:microcystin-dependent protein